MTGTLVNVAAIVAGSLIGLVLKKGIPERITGSILKVQGVAVIVISLNGIIGAMFRADVQTGILHDSGGLLLLVSLVLGCLFGELLRIEDRLNSFAKNIEGHFGASDFSKGFVAASLFFPIGAMAVIGPLYDGLMGDTSVLLVKSTLDFITSIVLASTLGFGVLFAAIPVFIIQGSLTLLAEGIYPFVSATLLDLFCMTGYAVVLCIGLNFAADAKIKVGNLLPALAIPVVYYFMLA